MSAPSLFSAFPMPLYRPHFPCLSPNLISPASLSQLLLSIECERRNFDQRRLSATIDPIVHRQRRRRRRQWRRQRQQRRRGISPKPSSGHRAAAAFQHRRRFQSQFDSQRSFAAHQFAAHSDRLARAGEEEEAPAADGSTDRETDRPSGSTDRETDRPSGQ